MDIIPPQSTELDLWRTPAVITLAACGGISLLVNIVLLVILFAHK